MAAANGNKASIAQAAWRSNPPVSNQPSVWSKIASTDSSNNNAVSNHKRTDTRRGDGAETEDGGKFTASKEVLAQRGKVESLLPNIARREWPHKASACHGPS